MGSGIIRRGIELSIHLIIIYSPLYSYMAHAQFLYISKCLLCHLPAKKEILKSAASANNNNRKTKKKKNKTLKTKKQIIGPLTFSLVLSKYIPVGQKCVSFHNFLFIFASRFRLFYLNWTFYGFTFDICKILRINGSLFLFSFFFHLVLLLETYRLRNVQWRTHEWIKKKRLSFKKDCKWWMIK